ncbi:MAG: ABC transporter permease [Chloroflexi bacterium]|nr:ABC transporter permease [Chloroflexota bacterium]
MSDISVARTRAGRLDLRFLYSGSRLIVLALLCIGMTILSPVFFTPTNLLNVLTVASVLIILAIGQTTVILTAGIDLSIGAVVSICGVLTGILLRAEVPFPIVIVAALILGSVLGFFNGLMVAIVRLPAFVATYGMMWVASGFALVILNGIVISAFDPTFRFLGVGNVFGIPTPIIVMLLFWSLAYTLLRRTTFGRSMYAVGANPEAARMSGIKKDRTLVLAYLFSGFMSALGAVVLVARVNASEPNMGDAYLLPTVAAVVIGGTSLFGGQGGLVGTLIGALIMTIVQNGMVLLGIKSEWQTFVLGALIVIAVLLDQWVRKSLPEET